jgi:hypothetical protein
LQSLLIAAVGWAANQLTDVAIRVLGCRHGFPVFVSDERVGRAGRQRAVTDYPIAVALVAGILAAV